MMPPDLGRPTEDDLAYIRYSAKELLFHQSQQINELGKDVADIRLNMVSRHELTAARRWAVGAAVAASGSFFALLKLLGA